MKTFHFDFNTVIFRPDTVARWLHDLSELGFDTILWEVENAFHWKSCPECAVPDTLPMDELRKLLKLARSLNFENIPLFQTLGHSEFVLVNEAYSHLRENGQVTQYCPSHPDLLPFLERWIDEYMEVFDLPKYFHIGADETMHLGACPICKARAVEHGVSSLYRTHVDQIIERVLAKGARPLVWADMFLSHPESLEGLSQEVIICDWAYDRHDSASMVQFFGLGTVTLENVSEAVTEAYGEHLYRKDSSPRQLNPWAAADHLDAQGFDLLLCPSVSHMGDAVYAPRTKLHMNNIGDSVVHAERLSALGTILTSWTWHLFPLELQRAMYVYYVKVADDGHVDRVAFLDDYGQKRLGLPAQAFAEICYALETACPLSDARQLRFMKGCRRGAVSDLIDLLITWRDDGMIQRMIDQTHTAEQAYSKASSMLEIAVCEDADAATELAAWKLAAEGLQLRAKTARCLLECYLDASAHPSAQSRKDAINLELAMRQRFSKSYLQNVMPHRAEEMLACQFDTFLGALVP